MHPPQTSTLSHPAVLHTFPRPLTSDSTSTAPTLPRALSIAALGLAVVTKLSPDTLGMGMGGWDDCEYDGSLML